MMKRSSSGLFPRRLADMWRDNPQDGAITIISDANLALGRFRLDEVGSFVWRHCDGTKTVGEIAKELAAACDGPTPPHETVVRDTVRLLQSLRDDGLVAWDGDRRVDALPVDFDWRQTLYVQDGPVYVALRPLEPANLGYRTPCRIERITDHVLVSIYNYDGPETRRDPDAMQMTHNGFVAEFGERSRFANLAAFKAHVARTTIEQQVSAVGIRQVRYTSGGDCLELHYDALREKILVATVNGRSTLPEYLHVTMQDERVPAFCPTRIW